jgi:heme/copper-type cytochrome/quinol oxidase subunit 2
VAIHRPKRYREALEENEMMTIMTNKLTRLVCLLLAVLVFAGAPAFGQSAKSFDVTIAKRHVTSAKTIWVHQGDAVRLMVSTDETVELHLHGIDITKKMQPGKVGEISFDAKITGRFPVTSHGFGGGHGHGHSALMYIEIHPK